MRVRDNGITFSKYTENAADRYEQMNLDLIFPKSANTVSAILALLVTLISLN